MKEKGVYTVVRNRGTNIEQIISYDMSNMIFIFVSDIGSLTIYLVNHIVCYHYQYQYRASCIVQDMTLLCNTPYIYYRQRSDDSSIT